MIDLISGPAEPQGHRDNVPVLFENLFSKSRKMSRCFFSVWSKFPVILKTFRRAWYVVSLLTRNCLCFPQKVKKIFLLKSLPTIVLRLIDDNNVNKYRYVCILGGGYGLDIIQTSIFWHYIFQAAKIFLKWKI